MMLLFLLLIPSVCGVYSTLPKPIPTQGNQGEINLNLRSNKETILGRHIAKISMRMLNADRTLQTEHLLLWKITVANHNNSVVISPLGIFFMLSLYANYAGPVSQKIFKLIGRADRDPKETVFQYAMLTHEIKVSADQCFNFSNIMFFDQKDHLSNGFVEFTQLYDVGIGHVNFQDEDHALLRINKWVKRTSRGINEVIAEKSIHANINTAFISIIHFIGQWHVGFDKQNIKDYTFYTPNVTKNNLIKIGMMPLKSILYYHESNILQARLLEIPSKHSYRMIVIFPNKPDSLPQLLSKLATGHNFYSEVENLSPKLVDVLMPMFDLSNTTDLKDTLVKMGLKGLFETPTSEIQDGRPTVISTVLQSAFIRVHAKGSSAGGYTGVQELSYSYYEKPVQYHLTHPFAFAVMHIDTVILLGVYQGR